MTDPSGDDIASLIREKIAHIARLQAELDEARKMLGGGERKARSYYSGSLTLADMAAQVLAERGAVTHVKDIIVDIERKFGVRAVHSSVAGTLHRLQRDQTTFYRTGRNVYGLLEWNTREDEHP